MRKTRTGWHELGLCGVLALAGGLCAGPGRAAAQANSPAAPQQSIAGELQSLARRAATIFVGQITGVERKGDTVEITFRVDQRVNGDVADMFVLREWAGRWAPGQMRYVPGLRAMVFAHGASSAGFSSPVDGSVGLVPLLVQGADAPALLDIRHLAASILRTPGTPLPTNADGAILLSDALKLIAMAASSEPVRLPLLKKGAASATWRVIGPAQGGQNGPDVAPGGDPIDLPLLPGGSHVGQ